MPIMSTHIATSQSLDTHDRSSNTTMAQRMRLLISLVTPKETRPDRRVQIFLRTVVIAHAAQKSDNG